MNARPAPTRGRWFGLLLVTLVASSFATAAFAGPGVEYFRNRGKKADAPAPEKAPCECCVTTATAPTCGHNTAPTPPPSTDRKKT